MFKSKKTIIRVGVLSAAALVVFGAPAAFAASSYNVTAGSAPATDATAIPPVPPVAYTANTTGPLPQVTFTDTTSGAVLNCESASAAGTITVGTNRIGTGIGTVDSTGWNNCTGPAGLQLTVTGSHPWSLNATGDTAGGVTAGTVSGVNAHVADNGGGCDFDVTGSVAGSYTNGTSNGTLTLPGTSTTLTISNVSGFLCGFAGIRSGDSASFRATYQVAADNADYNPIQITSNP